MASHTRIPKDNLPFTPIPLKHIPAHDVPDWAALAEIVKQGKPLRLDLSREEVKPLYQRVARDTRRKMAVNNFEGGVVVQLTDIPVTRLSFTGVLK